MVDSVCQLLVHRDVFYCNNSASPYVNIVQALGRENCEALSTRQVCTIKFFCETLVGTTFGGLF